VAGMLAGSDGNLRFDHSAEMARGRSWVSSEAPL
jgi:hypothetical protein